MNSTTKCPDCQVDPGSRHEEGCDTGSCRLTGTQFLMCETWMEMTGGPEHQCEPTVWTGHWPGKEQCRELGWYTHVVGIEGLTEDLNRLNMEGQQYGWDSEKERWKIPSDRAEAYAPENNAMVLEIINLTGLPYSTIESLLECGWVYRESMTEPNRWEKAPLREVQY